MVVGLAMGDGIVRGIITESEATWWIGNDGKTLAYARQLHLRIIKSKRDACFGAKKAKEELSIS
jgi:hypothetical protein